MKLGVFAKSFPRSTVEDNLQAVREHGFSCTQYNMTCAGLPTLPDAVPAAVCERVRTAHAARGLSMVALSGTFNVIDPDSARLKANLKRFNVLAAAAPSLGARVITLCSGTCDPDDMWRAHPDNGTPRAWREMLRSIHEIVRIAEAHGIDVAIEPEAGNVVDSAPNARRVLDEVGSLRLKIVFDVANIVHAGQAGAGAELLTEALDLLAHDTVIAHAKPLSVDGGDGFDFGADGEIDYAYLLSGLVSRGFSGPLVLHGVSENQAPAAIEYLRLQLADAGCPERQMAL